MLAPSIVCSCPCVSLEMPSAGQGAPQPSGAPASVRDSRFLDQHTLPVSAASSLCRQAAPGGATGAPDARAATAAAAAAAAAAGSLPESSGPSAAVAPPPALRPWGLAATVTFLGTGSAEPSKHRGSSGLLLDSGCGDAILLDAGEGVFNQMVHCIWQPQAPRLGCGFIKLTSLFYIIASGVLRCI